ncbi:hypothetical protein C0J52_00888 [Blattella germanica]|nr:hypothetical protein C0J52_00888 [Blattella germanica]
MQTGSVDVKGRPRRYWHSSDHRRSLFERHRESCRSLVQLYTDTERGSRPRCMATSAIWIARAVEFERDSATYHKMQKYTSDMSTNNSINKPVLQMD